MSHTQERTKAAHTRLNSANKGALIAALAQGMTQVEAAKHFNVHRNTVSKLFNAVRAVSNPANPVAKDWKERALAPAQVAVERGMNHADDPIGAANVALKFMYGRGYLSTNSNMHVDGAVGLHVTWGAVQGVDGGDIIDVQSNALTLTESASKETDPT